MQSKGHGVLNVLRYITHKSELEEFTTQRGRWLAQAWSTGYVWHKWRLQGMKVTWWVIQAIEGSRGVTGMATSDHNLRKEKSVESKRTVRRFLQWCYREIWLWVREMERKEPLGMKSTFPSMVDLAPRSSTCARIRLTPPHSCTDCCFCLLKGSVSPFTWKTPLHPSRHSLHVTFSWKASRSSAQSPQFRLIMITSDYHPVQGGVYLTLCI